MGESHRNNFRHAHFTKKKSNNGSSISNSKYKYLMCNWCHKKGHIKADSLTRKRQNANVTELSEGDEDKCDILSVSDRSVDNKDRWIIDF